MKHATLDSRALAKLRRARRMQERQRHAARCHHYFAGCQCRRCRGREIAESMELRRWIGAA